MVEVVVADEVSRISMFLDSSPALALASSLEWEASTVATLLLATLPFRVRDSTAPAASLQPLSPDSLWLSVSPSGVQCLHLLASDMLWLFL